MLTGASRLPGVPRRWLRLPRRTVRLRLTALYAVLFLASGAGVLAVTYVLVESHTPAAPGFAKGTKGGQIEIQTAGSGSVSNGSRPPRVCLARSDRSVSLSVGGVAASATLAGPGQPGVTKQCAAWVQDQVNAARADYLTSLLTDSGIALALLAIAALGLGWLVSGRVLRPLRTITLKAQQISASNLHERLALDGPDDELTDLGNTMDGLLARLETAFAAQRQFVANASHELRTPLARQQAMVEVALADPGRSVASLEAVCRRALAAGQQQERLIEALLTLARSQRGLDRLEPVDLAAIARATVLSRSADARLRDIEVALLDAPATFPGDARLAERLLENLLDNAIRHNHPGGRVLIATHTATGQVVLSVVNTGPVLDQAEVPELFEPFRRRGTVRAGPGCGLGLGLSIVAAIASAHGAECQAVAQPDGGLEITIRFGCPEEPPATGEASLPVRRRAERALGLFRSPARGRTIADDGRVVVNRGLARRALGFPVAAVLRFRTHRGGADQRCTRRDVARRHVGRRVRGVLQHLRRMGSIPQPAIGSRCLGRRARSSEWPAHLSRPRRQLGKRGAPPAAPSAEREFPRATGSGRRNHP